MEMSNTEEKVLPDQGERTPRFRQSGANSDPAPVRTSSDEVVAAPCQAGGAVSRATAETMEVEAEVDFAVPGPSGVQARAAVDLSNTSGPSRDLGEPSVLDTIEVSSSPGEEGDPQDAREMGASEQLSLSRVRKMTHSFIKDNFLVKKNKRGGGLGRLHRAKRSRTIPQLDYDSSLLSDADPGPDVDVDVASIPTLLDVILSRLTYVETMNRKSKNLKGSISGRMKDRFRD